eukprot:jgi/Tetstr1/435868/TSEL_024756.t1
MRGFSTGLHSALVPRTLPVKPLGERRSLQTIGLSTCTPRFKGGLNRKEEGHISRRRQVLVKCTQQDAAGLNGRPGWRKKYKSVLPFHEVQRMAQGMGLRSKDDWDEWVNEGKKSPWFGPYMPSDPDVIYADEWEGWDAFLGVMLPYNKARKISRCLGLKSQAEWWAYASGGGAGGIKAAADKAAAEGKGAAAVYRAAQLAADRLKSLESERKHPNLPAIPHEFYKDEWRGYDDWLGLESEVLTVPTEWNSITEDDS